jgi:hypothetical protein
MSRSLHADAFLSSGLGWAGVCLFPGNYLPSGAVPPSMRSNFTRLSILRTNAGAKIPIPGISLDRYPPCYAPAARCKTHSVPVLFSRV